jgi:hypothetical protein
MNLTNLCMGLSRECSNISQEQPYGSLRNSTCIGGLEFDQLGHIFIAKRGTIARGVLACLFIFLIQPKTLPDRARQQLETQHSAREEHGKQVALMPALIWRNAFFWSHVVKNW